MLHRFNDNGPGGLTAQLSRRRVAVALIPGDRWWLFPSELRAPGYPEMDCLLATCCDAHNLTPGALLEASSFLNRRREKTTPGLSRLTHCRPGGHSHHRSFPSKSSAHPLGTPCVPGWLACSPLFSLPHALLGHPDLPGRHRAGLRAHRMTSW